MRTAGSIWPVKRPPLKPPSTSSCVPGDERRARAVEEHHRPRLLLGDRVAAERHREVVHVLLADGLFELGHHRRVGRARVHAVDADAVASRASNERNAVYALMASFDRPYAFASSFGVRLAPRRAPPRSRASPAARTAAPCSASSRCPRSTRCTRSPNPRSCAGSRLRSTCRSPQKLTSITSRFGNVFGSPAQLNSPLTILPIFSTVVVDLRGLAEVALAEAREPGDVGLLDVDRVHLGAELDEDLARSPRPCPTPRR